MTRFEELLYKFKDEVLRPFPFLRDEGCRQFFWVVLVINMFIPTILYLIVEYDQSLLPPLPDDYMKFLYGFLYTFPLLWIPFISIVYDKRLSLQSITCLILFALLIILQAATTIL